METNLRQVAWQVGDMLLNRPLCYNMLLLHIHARRGWWWTDQTQCYESERQEGTQWKWVPRTTKNWRYFRQRPRMCFYWWKNQASKAPPDNRHPRTQFQEHERRWYYCALRQDSAAFTTAGGTDIYIVRVHWSCAHASPRTGSSTTKIHFTDTRSDGLADASTAHVKLPLPLSLSLSLAKWMNNGERWEERSSWSTTTTLYLYPPYKSDLGPRSSSHDP